MKFALILGLGLLGLAAVALVAQEDASRTVWDGVYTAQQADRGKTRFGDKCTYCHGDNLEGDAGGSPALTGSDFVWQWNGTTLDKLFDRIHHDMPFNQPGTLSRQAAADLLAYILSANQYPAGHSELPSDAQALAQIEMLAEKPTR